MKLYSYFYIFLIIFYQKRILFFSIKIILIDIYRHREEALNIARGIFQDTYFSELEDEEPMDVEEKSSSFSKSRCKSRSNRIMLSEWMFNVPQDFLENWIMVPCPVGKRTRLVSCRVLICLVI